MIISHIRMPLPSQSGDTTLSIIKARLVRRSLQRGKVECVWQVSRAYERRISDFIRTAARAIAAIGDIKEARKAA